MRESVMRTVKRTIPGLGLVVSLGAAAVVEAAPTVIAGAAGNAAGLAPTVDFYRNTLGNPNNGNALGPLAGGRREINWDAAIVPFNMPGNFFNTPPTTRGADFTTPGTGFNVSNDGVDNEFDSINPLYPGQFQTFSAARLFTPVGSNIVDVTFLVPGTSDAAFVTGFGAVFTDVDLPDSTKLEYYNVGGELVAEVFAPIADQGLSFAGVSFDDQKIAHVRIISGNAAVGPDDLSDGGVSDIVVMDDFIYGEPQLIPEPMSAMILAAGGTGLLLSRNRRRS